MGDFYGTKIEIRAGFGPVGITEKKLGPIMSNVFGRLFQVFMGKKNEEKKLFFSLKKIQKKNQTFYRLRSILNCVLLHLDTSLLDFSIMTLV